MRKLRFTCVNSGYNLYKVEYTDTSPVLLTTEHRHLNQTEMNLIRQGSASYCLADGTEIPLPEQSVVLIPTGVVHNLLVTGPVVMMGLHIDNSQLANRIYHNSAISNSERERIWQAGSLRVFNDPSMFQLLLPLMQQIKREYYSTNRYKKDSIEMLCHTLAYHYIDIILNDQSQAENDPTKQRILRTKAWIDQHFYEYITLDSLASMAQLSMPYYSNTFHSVVGMSPKTYIVQQRLQHAVKLLVKTNMTIKEIATSSGFEYLEHFNRIFRKYFQQTPSAYRKEHQASN